jgi:hypothetical protein
MVLNLIVRLFAQNETVLFDEIVRFPVVKFNM